MSPPVEPSPPHVSTGSVVSDGQGGWTWVQDPAVAYSDHEKSENGVQRKMTPAEVASLSSAPAVPAQVARYQARGALYAAQPNGALLAAVDALVAQQGGITAIWWSDAPNFLRADPRFDALGALLPTPLSPADIDALFVQAATL